MRKTLLIMRHAKSSWDDAGRADDDRPLTARGRRDAKTMGRWLRGRGLEPAIILASSARRAVKTARRMKRHAPFEAPVQVEDALYHAGAAELREAIAALPPTVAIALLVAHNPGVEDLVADLTSTEASLPTGAVAWIVFPDCDRWDATPGGKLCAVWRPREIVVS